MSAIRVVCENCGGTDWTAIAVGALGALVGVGALFYAARAFRVTNATLDLAEKQHALTAAQHDLERAQFDLQQADRAARAAFRLTVDLVNAENDVLITDATNTNVRLRVGVENVGTLAAGRTTVNLLVPERCLRWLRWSGPGGQELPEVKPADTTSEQVGGGADAGPSAYLVQVLDSVPRRTPVVLYATLSIEGLQPGTEQSLPVRAKAQADELAEDVFEETVEREFRVRRRTR
jgi:hypothetical protein